MIYTTTGAPVIGLGLLAARDIVSFLRHSNGADNPCAGDIQHAYAFGASQSGRFLRQLLYLGLHRELARWYHRQLGHVPDYDPPAATILFRQLADVMDVHCLGAT